MSADSGAPRQAESTRRREAYFLEYAADIRKVATMPLMVTGGFRTRDGMQQALASGATDVVGLGRPLCTDANAPAQLLAGTCEELPRHEHRLRLGPGMLAPGSKVFLFKLVNIFGQQGWYYLQLFRMADGLKPDYKLGVFGAFVGYLKDEYVTAWRLRRARRRMTPG